jgi:hypothetical protein
LKKNSLFSPKHTLEYINKGNIATATELMEINKKYYTISDLEDMKSIINQIDSLPDKGRIKSVKPLMGSPKDKYECPNKHTNDIGVKQCIVCGLDIKGLNENDIYRIDLFRMKVESLKCLFQQQA